MSKHGVFFGFVAGAGVALGLSYLAKKTNAIQEAKKKYDEILDEINHAIADMDDCTSENSEVHHMYKNPMGGGVNSFENVHPFMRDMHASFEQFVKEHTPKTQQDETEENVAETEPETKITGHETVEPEGTEEADTKNGNKH